MEYVMILIIERYMLNAAVQPWRMKYRRIGADDKVMTSRLNSPNDYLHVTEKGVYEIIDVRVFIPSPHAIESHRNDLDYRFTVLRLDGHRRDDLHSRLATSSGGQTFSCS
jgi:hypothetical protein